MASIKPLIGITGPRKRAFWPRFLVGVVVRWYGARALQIRPGDDVDLSQLDGVVITGGHDIDPVLYAAKQEVHPRHDKARDELESGVIDYFLQHQRPLLGICRGAQLLNVRLGGSLFQELKSRRVNTSNRWTFLPLKTLLVEGDSFLNRLFSCDVCNINSLHNQSVDRLGQGLRVSGKDLDGIVQAVEDPQKAFLVGVQWHPEFLIFNARQRRLFKALVAAAGATNR